jgi:hypothetical protein
MVIIPCCLWVGCPSGGTLALGQGAWLRGRALMDPRGHVRGARTRARWTCQGVTSIEPVGGALLTSAYNGFEWPWASRPKLYASLGVPRRSEDLVAGPHGLGRAQQWLGVACTLNLGGSLGSLLSASRSNPYDDKNHPLPQCQIALSDKNHQGKGFNHLGNNPWT